VCSVHEGAGGWLMAIRCAAVMGAEKGMYEDRCVRGCVLDGGFANADRCEGEQDCIAVPAGAWGTPFILFFPGFCLF
jgi:hypothetical protein